MGGSSKLAHVGRPRGRHARGRGPSRARHRLQAHRRLTRRYRRAVSPRPLSTNLEANIENAFGLRPFYGEVCSPCAGGDAVGVLVRLAFHDASGPNGADGCIDFSTGENAGVQGA